MVLPLAFAPEDADDAGHLTEHDLAVSQGILATLVLNAFSVSGERAMNVKGSTGVPWGGGSDRGDG